ncbi:MAG: class I SAM-dependent methyltransferase [Gammaproteobacteria bacterium]|nr:class I SAM-dependent methyltransferase [Gammaproteobacteria bacterium]
MQQIPVASLDPDRYAETFGVFVAHSLEYPQMLSELAAIVRDRCPDGFQLLDIGAGTGLMIRGLIEVCNKRPAHYTAFEPNARHARDLHATLARLGLPHEIHETPYSRDTRLDRTYDLVLFSHSLYWMPDPAAVMLQAADAVAPGGSVLAFIAGPYGVHAMFPLFEPRLRRTSPMLQNNAISSHELVIGLRARGVEPQVKMLPTPIDVSGLFEPSAAAELGEFISFCLQVEFSDLPLQLQDDIIGYVRGGCVPSNGRLYWYSPTAAVTVSGHSPER